MFLVRLEKKLAQNWVVIISKHVKYYKSLKKDNELITLCVTKRNQFIFQGVLCKNTVN